MLSEQESKKVIEDRKKLSRIELPGSLVTLLCTAFTIGFGVYELPTQLKYNEEAEFKRNLWDMQVNRYIKACDLAGKISNSTDQVARYKEYVEKFSGLYFSEINIIRDSLAENAMKEFYYAAKDVDGSNQSAKKLIAKAAELSRECSRASLEGWNRLNILEPNSNSLVNGLQQTMENSGVSQLK